jgi:hypothetical protein
LQYRRYRERDFDGKPLLNLEKTANPSLREEKDDVSEPPLPPAPIQEEQGFASEPNPAWGQTVWLGPKVHLEEAVRKKGANNCPTSEE